MTEKMRVTAGAAKVEAEMSYLSKILKVQLARENRKKDGLAKDCSFIECAQELMDVSARDEEVRIGVEEPGWSHVAYMRPRAMPGS